MLILNEKQRRLASGGFLALSLMIGTNVIYRAFNPEKLLSPEQAAAIAIQQENNYYSLADYGSDSYIRGLLLGTIAALGAGSLGYSLASKTQTKTFHPDAALPVTIGQLEKGEGEVAAKRVKQTKRLENEPVSTTRLKAADELRGEVAHKVAEWIKEWPWMLAMLKTPMVILVGQPGTGKSSIMQMIALIRHLLFHCGIDICDLDIDQNIQNKVWMHGVAHGSERHGSFISQIDSLTHELKGEMFSGEQGHTVLFDEVSRWISHDHFDYKQLLALLGTTHQEWRRQNIRSIWGLHSLGVGETMGKDSCTKFTTIKDYAAILYLHPKCDMFGTPIFSGLASFKRAGEKCGDSEGFMERHETIAIPKIFQPAEVLRMLGGQVKDLDIGIKEPDVAANREIDAWVGQRAQNVRETISQTSRARPAERDLEPLFSEPVDSKLTDEFYAHLGQRSEPVKTEVPDVDWQDVEDSGSIDRGVLAAFHHKTVGAAAKISREEDGSFRIRLIWNNWGKHQKRWPDIGDFKAFLRELEEYGIGKVWDEDQKWAWNELNDAPWMRS